MTSLETAPLSRRVAAWSMVALGLAIPASTAADSLMLGVLLICAILSPRHAFAGMRRSVLTTPPIAAALVLFAWLAIRCAYSIVPAREAIHLLGKYLDLALIALLAWAVFDRAVRNRAIACYAVAMVANLYVSYTAAAGLPGLRNPHYPIGFKASVTHNLMLSLGAFLFLLWARETTDRRLRVAYLLLAAVCVHNVLFIIIGRTGYLVLALLLVYFAFTLVRGWRGVVAGVVLISALAPLTYFTSDSFRSRIDEIATDFERWKPGARDKTSVGLRIEYYRSALGIIAEHPWIGVGTGGFTKAFAEEVRGTPPIATTNPHNDYLLIGVQAGIPGMVLLVLFYAITWRYAAKLGTPFDRDLLRGVVITLAVGGLFNSLLLDHTEGFLLAWFIAVLCSARAVPTAAHVQAR